MNIPKRTEEESLAMWVDRLVREFKLDAKTQAIMHAVSVESYVKGGDDIFYALKEEGRLKEP